MRLDLNFIEAYLPDLYDHLHYRMLDVTSWAGPAQWWSGVPLMAKGLAHTAMADIEESIAEMRYLREALGRGPKLLTLAEAARALDVGRSTVDRMIADDRLPVTARTPGGHRRVSRDAVRDLRLARTNG